MSNSKKSKEKSIQTHIVLKLENHIGNYDFISLSMGKQIIQFRSYNTNKTFESKQELLEFLKQQSDDFLELIEDIKPLDIPNQDNNKELI